MNVSWGIVVYGFGKIGIKYLVYRVVVFVVSLFVGNVVIVIIKDWILFIIGVFGFGIEFEKVVFFCFFFFLVKLLSGYGKFVVLWFRRCYYLGILRFRDCVWRCCWLVVSWFVILFGWCIFDRYVLGRIVLFCGFIVDFDEFIVSNWILFVLIFFFWGVGMVGVCWVLIVRVFFFCVIFVFWIFIIYLVK